MKSGFPAPRPPFREPYANAAMASILLAIFLPLGFLFLLAVGEIVSVPSIREHLHVVLGFWILAAPFLATGGAAVCCLRLSHVPQPLPGIVAALFVHIAVLSFAIDSFAAGAAYANPRHQQRTAGKQTAGKLLGKLENGVYRSPGRSWQIDTGKLGELTVIDQYDAPRNTESVRLKEGESLWLVDVMPVESSGLPATISPSDFVEALAQQKPSPGILAAEKRLSPSGLPTLRVFMKTESGGEDGAYAACDHACLNGAWYRLGAAIPGSGDYDKAALEEKLQRLWSAMIFPATPSPPQ